MNITDIIMLVETIKSDLSSLATERRKAEHSKEVNNLVASFFETISKEENIICLLEEYLND